MNIKPPLLTGRVGCGKTRMLYALKQKLSEYVAELPEYEKETSLPIKFKNTIDLINDVKQGISTNTTRDILKKYKEVDFLIIDDFGAERSAEYSYEIYWELLGYRYEYCKATIIATNLSMAEISKMYGDRIASRLLEMCQLIKMVDKDYRA